MILYSADPKATEPDVGSAVDEVRNLIMERTGENGLVDDKGIRSFLRRANRTVWKQGVKRNPDAWKERTADFTFPQSPGYFAIDSLGGVDPDAGSAAAGSDLALSFGTSPIHKLCYLEVFYLGDYYPVGPLNNPEDRYIFEPGTKIFAGPHQPANFYIEGGNLRLTPPPLMDLTCRAVVVPVLTDPADSEELLGGRYSEHHDVVTTLAARLCFAKDEKASTPWDAEYKDLLGLFLMDLAEPQGMQTRRVAPRGPYT